MSADTEPTTLRLDAEDGLAGTAIAARWVGERMPRTEDQRMITGHGRYVDDLDKPGMVHATFVRSTVARGRIVELDVSEARRAPGVVAVLTAAEISSRIRPSVPGPVDKTPRRLLADGDVRYVGEPIAIVVAESRYLAEDAAELVSVDIDPGEAVVTVAQALAEGSPRVHPELPDNLSGVVPAEDLPSLDVLFENAAHVFTETFRSAPLRLRADGDARHGRGVGSVDRAARAEHLRPRRALAPVALLPDAGHPRGRHPGHHGRCRRVVRAEDLPDP